MKASLGYSVVALLLVSVALPVTEAGTRDRQFRGEDDWEKKWDGIPAGRQAEAMQKAEQRGLFGKFTFDPVTKKVSGRFVNFTWDNSTKSLVNYTVRGIPAFDSLTLTTTFQPTKIKAVGSILRAKGPAGSIGIHNNPKGLIVFHANTTLTVTMDLVAGSSVTPFPGPNATGKSYRIGYPAPNNGSHSHLVRLGNATLTATNESITIGLAAGDGFVWAMHPEARWKHLEKRFHDEINGMVTGRFGGSIDVVDADGTPVDVPLDLGVTMSATSLTKGKAVIKVTGEGAGKVVIIRLDPDLFTTVRVKVKLDNRDLAVGSDTSITLASNATTASASAEVTNESVNVAVAVDTFSDHTVTIESEGAAATGTATTTAGGATTPADGDERTPALGPMLVLLGIGVGLLGFRRRR